MPLHSVQNERQPPGGSSFGGHFENRAFAAYIFPDPGKRRHEPSEHQKLIGGTQAMHASSLAFTLAREARQKSRLRAACDEHLERLNAAPSKLLSISLHGSASSPSLHGSEAGHDTEVASARVESVPPSSRASARGSTGLDLGSGGGLTGQDLLKQAAASMNTRKFPHPCTNRGSLKLTAPSALQWGIDPKKELTHQCPFWEGDAGRSIARQDAARPRTPTKSLRWRSEAAWFDPANQTVLKVTQTLPRSTMKRI